MDRYGFVADDVYSWGEMRAAVSSSMAGRGCSVFDHGMHPAREQRPAALAAGENGIIGAGVAAQREQRAAYDPLREWRKKSSISIQGLRADNSYPYWGAHIGIQSELERTPPSTLLSSAVSPERVAISWLGLPTGWSLEL
jgi:hypothetical protein